MKSTCEIVLSLLAMVPSFAELAESPMLASETFSQDSFYFSSSLGKPKLLT